MGRAAKLRLCLLICYREKLDLASCVVSGTLTFWIRKVSIYMGSFTATAAFYKWNQKQVHFSNERPNYPFSLPCANRSQHEDCRERLFLLQAQSPVCLIVAIMSAVCCSNLISHHLRCRGGLSAMHQSHQKRPYHRALGILGKR